MQLTKDAKTRPGLENWLVPGTKVKLVNCALLATSFRQVGIPFPLWPGYVGTVVEVHPDSNVPTGLRFKLHGLPWAFAPEALDGTVVWEPLE